MPIDGKKLPWNLLFLANCILGRDRHYFEILGNWYQKFTRKDKRSFFVVFELTSPSNCSPGEVNPFPMYQSLTPLNILICRWSEGSEVAKELCWRPLHVPKFPLAELDMDLQFIGIDKSQHSLNSPHMSSNPDYFSPLSPFRKPLSRRKSPSWFIFLWISWCFIFGVGENKKKRKGLRCLDFLFCDFPWAKMCRGVIELLLLLLSKKWVVKTRIFSEKKKEKEVRLRAWKLEKLAAEE